MSVPHWRLYYHVVWATRERAPLLTEPCHDRVERSIRATARDAEATVHAVGMVVDHVHVAVSIPPSIAISTVVGKLKGASSRLLNTAGPYAQDARFGWQQEYGVYSVSERSLGDVCAYVNDQPRRHAANDTIPGLERT
jgi:putative transposase